MNTTTQPQLDLEERCRALLNLGNSPESVQRILTTSLHADDEEAEQIVRRVVEERQKRQAAVLGATARWILVIAVCLGLVAFMQASPAAAQRLLIAAGLQEARAVETSLSETTPGSEPVGGVVESSEYLDPGILPEWMRAVIPEGARILKPKPIVVTPLSYGAPRVRCPQSPGEAARLFGGHMKQWQPAMGGWTMISAETVAVTVPEGMTAGYLVYIQRPEFYSVPGPVLIENVNFLAISCE